MDNQVFLKAFEEMGDAFGKTVNSAMAVQYYKSLGCLSESQIRELFQWAVENIDAPFPRIAVLTKHAKEEGWFREEEKKRHRDPFAHVTCPLCKDEFSVRRLDLERAAEKDWVFLCPDNYRTGCKGVVRAKEALASLQKATSP